MHIDCGTTLAVMHILSAYSMYGMQAVLKLTITLSKPSRLAMDQADSSDLKGQRRPHYSLSFLRLAAQQKAAMSWGPPTNRESEATSGAGASRASGAEKRQGPAGTSDQRASKKPRSRRPAVAAGGGGGGRRESLNSIARVLIHEPASGTNMYTPLLYLQTIRLGHREVSAAQ